MGSFRQDLHAIKPSRKDAGSLFIDFNKAYDSIYRSSLFLCMLVKADGVFIIGNESSEQFTIMQEFHQGEVLSYLYRVKNRFWRLR